MLELIYQFESAFNTWLPNSKWTFVQLAEKTGNSLDHVVDVLSDVLDNEYDLSGTITREEVERAIAVLKERMRPLIEAREKNLLQRQERAIKLYEANMEKVRVLQQTRNWSSAYRTLSNFVGTNEADLPQDVLLFVYGEILRLGIKANDNLQQLAVWMKKAITICCNPPTKAGLEEALDFIDAYGEYFYSDTTNNGRKVMSSIIKEIKEPVGEFGLSSNFSFIMRELGVDAR